MDKSLSLYPYSSFGSGLFPFLATVKSAAMSICAFVLVWRLVLSSLGYIERSWVAGLHGNFMFNYQIVFHSSWNILHLGDFQFLHIITNDFIFFDYSHPSVYEVAPLCSFDLHFPNDYWRWASFHEFMDHL